MDSNKLASLLLNLAYALFSVFLVIILVESLPLRLLDPDWILTLSASLVNAVTIPLVGLGLVHLAVHFASEPRFQLIQQRLGRLARWVSLGFVLILPLLVLLTFLNGQKIDRANATQKVQIELKAEQIRKAVATANTPKELQRAMVALQGPQVTPADFNQPLPQIKQQILGVVAQAKSSFLAQQKGPYSKEYVPVFKQILRICLLSLISSFGFASLAWNPKTNKSLLTAWLEAFRSLARLLKLSGIKKSWSTWTAALRERLEANRVTKGRREQAKQRLLDENRLEARRKKEFKRKENEIRKMRQRAERQRRR